MAKKTDDAKVVSDAMEADLTALSDEDFMEVWTNFGTFVSACRDRLKEFNQEHQKRERKAMLKRQMDLTPADLELVQEIVAEGSESQEEVGTP